MWPFDEPWPFNPDKKVNRSTDKVPSRSASLFASSEKNSYTRYSQTTVGCHFPRANKRIPNSIPPAVMHLPTMQVPGHRLVPENIYWRPRKSIFVCVKPRGYTLSCVPPARVVPRALAINDNRKVCPLAHVETEFRSCHESHEIA